MSEGYELWDTDSGNCVMYDENMTAAAFGVQNYVIANGDKDVSLLLPAGTAIHGAGVSRWANAVISLVEQGRIEQ